VMEVRRCGKSVRICVEEATMGAGGTAGGGRGEKAKDRGSVELGEERCGHSGDG